MRGVLMDPLEEGPAAGADVALKDGPAVDRAAAASAAKAPSKISKNRSALSGVSSIPRRILTVTGISEGTASRTRRTASECRCGLAAGGSRRAQPPSPI